jgi:alkylated DNA nucleotide flippase Atl1
VILARHQTAPGLVPAGTAARLVGALLTATEAQHRVPNRVARSSATTKLAAAQVARRDCDIA